MVRVEGAWFPVCVPQGVELSLDEPIAEWACDVTENR